VHDIPRLSSARFYAIIRACNLNARHPLKNLPISIEAALLCKKLETDTASLGSALGSASKEVVLIDLSVAIANIHLTSGKKS
jgi:hypothetical protein